MQQQRKTYTIDASGKVLGRLAVEIAVLLRGKNMPSFSPHNIDSGGEVIVINTSKIKITGRKAELKKYYHHSSYHGGLKEINYRNLFAKDSSEVLRRAVYGMLPRNKLRAKMMKKLKLFKKNKYDKN